MDNKRCPQCRKEFRPKRKSQKYCSNPCKLKAVNESLQRGAKANYSFEKRSLASKKVWANKDAVLSKRNTEAYRLNIGQKTKERFLSDDFKEKHKKACSRAVTPERKRKLSIIALERQNSGNQKVITKPNLIIADVLRILGLETNFEKPIKDICRSDFVFYDKKIAIEVYGDYWHANPLVYSIDGAPDYTRAQMSNMANDSLKDRLLGEECPEYRVVRLWESDVYFCLRKCVVELEAVFSVKWPITDIKDFSLVEISAERAKNFCFKYHYLGKKFPVAPRVCYGLFWRSYLVGVAVYALPSYCGEKDRWELSRFCLIPLLPKNSASWFLSRTVNFVKEKGIVGGLVSYADTEFHLGSIYKATNWIEKGQVKGSYHYVNEGGDPVSRQYVWRHCKSLGISEKDYARNMGFVKIDGSLKRKFIVNF